VIFNEANQQMTIICAVNNKKLNEIPSMPIMNLILYEGINVILYINWKPASSGLKKYHKAIITPSIPRNKNEDINSQKFLFLKPKKFLEISKILHRKTLLNVDINLKVNPSFHVQ
jgi:hypothetical protein